MNYKIVKLSVRLSENLKIRIELLAKKNNLTFTKMLDYIAEIGYQTYMKRFEIDEGEMIENEKN